MTEFNCVWDQLTSSIQNTYVVFLLHMEEKQTDRPGEQFSEDKSLLQEHVFNQIVQYEHAGNRNAN